MSQLVPTLRALLAEADGHMAARQPAKARKGFEDLLATAQEKADHAMTVIARSMLARIAVHRRAADEARAQLADAALSLDPRHLESHGRYRASLARLAVLEGPEEAARAELRHYLDWAETEQRWDEAVDALDLLASHSGHGAEAREWLDHAVEIATMHGIHDQLGRLYTHLAALFEHDEKRDRALDAHQQALAAYRVHGSQREVVAGCWAVGASGLAMEDWPLARRLLEECLSRAENDGDCQDLVPLALADLAAVHECTGDEVEARRLLIDALEKAREQDLPTFWPERWAAMARQATRLGLHDHA